MKFYVAGPIVGKHDNNRTAFHDAATFLKRRGHEVVIPLDIAPHVHDGPCPEGPIAGEDSAHSAPCFMRSDIKEMLNCDAIYLLDGWIYSSGARTEFEVARACGLIVAFQRTEPVV